MNHCTIQLQWDWGAEEKLKHRTAIMRLLLHNIQKPTRYIKRLASSTTTKTTTTKRPKFGRYQFLTPGFQPTAIIGDNIGFYHGSTFFDGVPPDTLPILDTSVIL